MGVWPNATRSAAMSRSLVSASWRASSRRSASANSREPDAARSSATSERRRASSDRRSRSTIDHGDAAGVRSSPRTCRCLDTRGTELSRSLSRSRPSRARLICTRFPSPRSRGGSLGQSPMSAVTISLANATRPDLMNRLAVPGDPHAIRAALGSNGTAPNTMTSSSSATSAVS